MKNEGSKNLAKKIKRETWKLCASSPALPSTSCCLQNMNAFGDLRVAEEAIEIPRLQCTSSRTDEKFATVP